MERINNLEFSLFHTHPNKVALQRSEEATVVFRADACVHRGKRGFVGVQFLFDLIGLNLFHSSNRKIDFFVFVLC